MVSQMTDIDPNSPDLIPQLINKLEVATKELRRVKKVMGRDRKWVRFDIGLSVLGIVIAVLLYFVWNGQNEQRHREKVTAHNVAVVQCRSTDEIRAKIRLGNDTTALVISSFFPADAPPQFKALLDQAQAKWASVDAGIPDIDCTKIP